MSIEDCVPLTDTNLLARRAQGHGPGPSIRGACTPEPYDNRCQNISHWFHLFDIDFYLFFFIYASAQNYVCHIDGGFMVAYGVNVPHSVAGQGEVCGGSMTEDIPWQLH